jgi:integrase
VNLSAIRKLVGEARRNGMIAREEADNLTDIPNVQQKGTRLGIWLTREQAKQLLTVPDRSKLKGKRDYVIIALLVGCALRRRELATLNIEDIQLREGRWVGPPQRARHHIGWALLAWLMSVKGCTDFADVCAMNADRLVKLFTGDAEGLRPVSNVRGHLGVDLVRVQGSSLF